MNAAKPLLVASAFAVAGAASAARLTFGSPAPPLAVAKWYKGAPISALKRGRVYVVEFWATWCGPCKEAMPHLSALAKKHAAKVDFIGVGVWERPEALAADARRVREFVAAQGVRMAYRVGGDDARGAMAKTWMDAAGEGGIPATFIVDAQGRVAWIGDPKSLEAPLEQILAGTYDLAAASRARDAGAARRRAATVDLDAASDALKAKEYDAALLSIEKGWKNAPTMRSSLLFLKFQALSGKLSEADAYADLRRMAATDLKDDGDMLWRVAWMIADERFRFVKTRDYAFAAECAKRSVDLARVPDWNRLAVLAMARYGNKEYGPAVRAQEECLAIARKEDSLSDENVKALEGDLAKYKAAMGGT